jgi:hypothetical protein
MKFGMRTPSPMRSFRAMTTGRLNRAVKRAIIPGYGRKGIGLLHPRRALRNQIYRRTTFGINDLAKAGAGSQSPTSSSSGGACLLTVLLVFIVILLIL